MVTMVRANLLWNLFLRQAAEAPCWPTHDHVILSAGSTTVFLWPGPRSDAPPEHVPAHPPTQDASRRDRSSVITG
jgi:hypothetical protein